MEVKTILTNSFRKIKQCDNILIEAAIINEILKLKLTVLKSDNLTNVFVGEIKSLKEYKSLDENFDTF